MPSLCDLFYTEIRTLNLGTGLVGSKLGSTEPCEGEIILSMHQLAIFCQSCLLFPHLKPFVSILQVFEGFSHGEAYHPLYFWFYFVFMNAIWIVVPLLCIWESYQELSKAQALTDRTAARVTKKKQ